VLYRWVLRDNGVADLFSQYSHVVWVHTIKIGLYRQSPFSFLGIKTEQLGEGTVRVHEVGVHIPRKQAGVRHSFTRDIRDE
jgi:hypothetical protein